mgnify:CR=1 FL=1
MPKPSEIRDRIDALELATMWSAGFPEPRTFTMRVARILAERRDEFDVVHDNQSLGSALLKIAESGLPVVATVHHPITRDRVVEIAAAKWWRKPLVRRWYGFAEMQKKVARKIPELLTVSSSSAADIAEDFGHYYDLDLTPRDVDPLLAGTPLTPAMAAQIRAEVGHGADLVRRRVLVNEPGRVRIVEPRARIAVRGQLQIRLGRQVRIIRIGSAGGEHEECDGKRGDRADSGTTRGHGSESIPGSAARGAGAVPIPAQIGFRHRSGSGTALLPAQPHPSARASATPRTAIVEARVRMRFHRFHLASKPPRAAEQSAFVSIVARSSRVLSGTLIVTVMRKEPSDPAAPTQRSTIAVPSTGAPLTVPTAAVASAVTGAAWEQGFQTTFLSTARLVGAVLPGDRITGRVDDVLNVSGHRMGTAEVESALVAHDKVSEAAVVGYPHDLKGQGIYCYVTLMDGEEPSDELRKELVAHVRKEIGPIASPDKIQFAPGLPKTRSGKIMRRILRKIATDDYEALGDISTLSEPGVVQQLIADRKAMG